METGAASIANHIMWVGGGDALTGRMTTTLAATTQTATAVATDPKSALRAGGRGMMGL